MRGSKTPSMGSSSAKASQQHVHTPELHRHSTAMSSVSMVEGLANKSKFHDEALCQLLRAARNADLGEVAKKAIRGAARSRLVELARLQESGQVRRGTCWWSARQI